MLHIIRKYCGNSRIIVDIWGAARIAGTLDKKDLRFNKIYTIKSHAGTCSTLIHYSFSKPKRGNVWKGEFVITNFHPNELGRDLLEVSDDLVTVCSTQFEGRSCCKIYPISKNAYGIMSGPIRVER